MESEVRSRFRPSLGGPPAHPPLHESVINPSLFKTLMLALMGFILCQAHGLAISVTIYGTPDRTSVPTAG